MKYRLTQYAHGGGCACKIPPGELEAVVAGLIDTDRPGRRLLVGLDDGDDAAVVRIERRPGRRGHRRLLHPGRRRPVRLGPHRRRQRALRRVRDGRPARRRGQPARLAARRAADGARRARCCAAGSTSRARRGCHVAGGHSVDDPEPKYGMAVTGLADPDRLLRNDAGRAGHAAVADQAAGHRRAEHPAQGDRRGLPARGRGDDDAQRAAPPAAALARRRRAAPPTSPASGCSATCYKLARASGVTAVIDAAAVPYLDGARDGRCATATSPAAPGATSTGCARTPTSATSTRTTAAAPGRRPDLRRAAGRRRDPRRARRR